MGSFGAHKRKPIGRRVFGATTALTSRYYTDIRLES
jgi:hypothetical protein